MHRATDRGSRADGPPPPRPIPPVAQSADGHRAHRRVDPFLRTLRVPTQRETDGQRGDRRVHDLDRGSRLQGLPRRGHRSSIGAAAGNGWKPTDGGWEPERGPPFQKRPAVFTARDRLRDEPAELARHPSLRGGVFTVVPGPGGGGESSPQRAHRSGEVAGVNHHRDQRRVPQLVLARGVVVQVYGVRFASLHERPVRGGEQRAEGDALRVSNGRRLSLGRFGIFS